MPLTDEERNFLSSSREADNTAQQVVEQAARKKPDHEAELNRLSLDTGLSRQLIETDIDEARRVRRMKLLDLEGIGKRSPHTAEFVSDPDKADVVSDSIESFEKIESNIRAADVSAADVALTIPAGAVEGFGMGLEGIGHQLSSYDRTVTRLVNKILGREGMPVSWRANIEDPFVTKAARLPEKIVSYAGAKLKEGAAAIDLSPEERSQLGYWGQAGVDITKATGQLAAQALTYIVNPTLGVAQLWGQGVDQAAQRQIESGTYGRDPLAEAGLLAGGVITTATEKMGIDALLNRLPPQIKNKILRNLTDVAMGGGIEAIQEVAEGILHGINEKLTSNPDAAIFEGLDREAIAAGGAGAIVRALTQLMTPGKSRAVDAGVKEGRKNLAITESQDLLDQRIFYAQENEVLKRDPETFREFIESQAADSYVFVRPDALTDIEGLPDEILSQIDGTGASVSIKMSTFLTDIVPDEGMLERIRPHISMREGDPSQSEMQVESAPMNIHSMIESASQRTQAMEEAWGIYEEVKDQIVGTMRQGEETAKHSASLLPALIVTQQAKMAAEGKQVSIRQLYDDIGLKIIGPEQAVNPARSVFEQDLYVERGGEIGFREDRVDDMIDEMEVSSKGGEKGIGFTDERITSDIEDVRYVSGKTKGFVAMVDPAGFLPTTTTDPILKQQILDETLPLGEQGIESKGTPMVEVVEEDGVYHIIGHEGRHRLQGMANAGYTSVPIMIRLREPADAGSLDSVTELMGQDHGGGLGAGQTMQISNPIAMTRDNKDRIVSEYGGNQRTLYQRDQDFEGLELVETFEEDGNVYQSTTNVQQQWDENHRRLDMIEELRACLKAS